MFPRTLFLKTVLQKEEFHYQHKNAQISVLPQPSVSMSSFCQLDGLDIWPSIILDVS